MPGPDHPLISIVSPVYGAPELVAGLVRRIVAAVTPVTSDFEILLVNDACPKGSWAEIVKAAAAEPRVTGLNLSRNAGQHRAITAGLDHARGEWVVVMDCDLQDQPEEIPRLYAKAREGYHTVFGRRHERKDSLAKRAPSRAFAAFFAWLSGARIDRTIANFSISHRLVIEGFRQYRELDRAFPMIVHLMGFRRAYIDVEHAARPSGQSAYTFRKLLSFALQVVVAGSNKPLHLSIKAGGGLALLSFAYALFLIIRYYLFGTTVEGWTSLAVLVAFFNGLLFVQLGVIGLYLGKTFDESKRRPLYHVMDTTSDAP
ncbi:MAG: glycosyltransferase family 2 protein [Kiritimatiellia bacterium]